MKHTSTYKVAIVHDSIRYFGGAERVLLALKHLWPDADIYTSTICWEDLGEYRDEVAALHPRTAFVQRLGLFRRYPFLYRYLLPVVWRSFNFSGYDLVISSSYAQMSHLIYVPPGTTHICYSHSPPRHLYGYETDFPWKKYFIIRSIATLFNHALRRIDVRAAQRVDVFVASSQTVAARIKKYYRRNARVIYPPVFLGTALETKHKAPHKEDQGSGYYLVVSRLSKRKHVEVAIEACNTLGAPLVIAGIGPEMRDLKESAGPTVTFVGFVRRDLPRLYKNCTAVIATSTDEDFGIVPVEAMSFGKPVIAFDSGGHKETVRDAQTGVLFAPLTAKRLIGAMKRLERLRVRPQVCRQQAELFSPHVFYKNMSAVVTQVTPRNEIPLLPI